MSCARLNGGRIMTSALFSQTWRAFLTFTFAAVSLFGQADSRISGTVQDPAGALMPGVKVTATDVNRGIAQTTVTNDTGRYAFPTLPVGEYVITAEAPGFKKAVAAAFRLE